ncbi:toll-like receptor 5 isoform X1 [Python bivittatus]|uniref:Toll-like receptor 5 isoform X1 n=1 Tax=Python bivittatus TaxID=176946 RepID=A0A9F2WJP5_PYTBI|nr:toll-like receptor 5 isoform X1 [Python bivittatus]
MSTFCRRWPLWKTQKGETQQKWAPFATIVSVLVALSYATDAFPDCHITKINNLMVTNCQGQGHRSVPRVNMSTQVLLLNFNILSTIQISSFPRMSALKMLSVGKQLGGALFVGERAFANVPNITFLDLGGNGNLSLHPKALHGLSKLEVLHLDVNGFDNGILERGYFQDLLSLKTLDLTGNHINRLRPDPTFQKLKKLSILQLKLNKIGAICGNDLQYLSGRHLTLLDLSSNRLSRYPSCINPFHNITLGTLDISSNIWNVVQVEQFFKRLNGTRIQNLKMQHSGAIGSGFDFHNIKDISASTFSGLRHSGILTFDMSHGFLSVLNASVFSSFPDLNTLLLRFNKINKIQDGAFAGLNKLQVLDLSNNLLGEIYTKGLQKLRSFPLQRLILKSNHIGIVQYGALTGLNTLQFLDLQDNALVRVPTGNLPSLLNLNLGQNRITDPWGIEQLGKNLIRLDFSSNRLSDLEDVWNHVAKIPTLNFLNLSSNHLARCLRVEKSPRQLEELDLSHNNLEKIWNRQKCIDIFQHLEKLVVLNLSSNHLQDLPGNLFHSLVSLEILNLSANMLHRLPDQVFHSLKSLHTLSVRGNPLMTLSLSSFQPLVRLQFLDLRELSFVCSCDLKDFQNWLWYKKATVSGTELLLTCIQTSFNFQRQFLPQFLQNKCVP